MAQAAPQPVAPSSQVAEASRSPPSAQAILDVLSQAGAIFFRWDPFAGLTFLSASRRGLLGYSREELLNDPNVGARLMDPSFLRDFDRMGASFYVVTGEAVRVTIPFIAHSGERVWMEARIVPEITESGAVSGFLGIALEVPRREAEPAGEPTGRASPT